MPEIDEDDLATRQGLQPKRRGRPPGPAKPHGPKLHPKPPEWFVEHVKARLRNIELLLANLARLERRIGELDKVVRDLQSRMGGPGPGRS